MANRFTVRHGSTEQAPNTSVDDAVLLKYELGWDEVAKRLVIRQANDTAEYIAPIYYLESGETYPDALSCPKGSILIVNEE